MLPELQKMTAEERLKQNRCPECGVRLDGLSILAERNRHWERFPKDEPPYQEARKRFRMLTQLAADRQPAALIPDDQDAAN